MLKAILFDLDGTLLRVDTKEFMTEYLKDIAASVAPLVAPERFTRALLASTNIMLLNKDPGVTNEEVFWADFKHRLNDCIEELMPLVEDFYARKFTGLARVVLPGAEARLVVEEALGQGLRIVLATNPLFPINAIHERMVWAGIDGLPWEIVTSYENMHFCKPYPDYYLEISDRLRLKPGECIMVGNDIEKGILPAATAGMRTYHVTEYMINHGRVQYQADGSGSLAELKKWLSGIRSGL